MRTDFSKTAMFRGVAKSVTTAFSEIVVRRTSTGSSLVPAPVVIPPNQSRRPSKRPKSQQQPKRPKRAARRPLSRKNHISRHCTAFSKCAVSRIPIWSGGTTQAPPFTSKSTTPWCQSCGVGTFRVRSAVLAIWFGCLCPKTENALVATLEWMHISLTPKPFRRFADKKQSPIKLLKSYGFSRDE